MAILASLTNRIFLASAALAVLSIAAAVYFVSRTATAAAEAELQRGLIEAGALVDQQCATLIENFTVMARLVAELPRLKAAVDTVDRPTVQPVAEEYREQLHAALLVLTGRQGQVLADAGDMGVSDAAVAALPEIQQALAGRESTGFWPTKEGMLQVMTVPITIGLQSPEIMGVLAIGFRLDNELAAQFKRATESDIAFAVGGQVRASTLPAADREHLSQLLHRGGVQTVALGDGEYVALRRPLVKSEVAVSPAAASVLLLRSRTERLRFLNSIHAGLGIVGMLAVLAATILSYAVARTITRPLGTITAVMREMSATGDLTRKISIGPASSWDDEDAKLLASTFNTLTDSIARSQREGAQRERLSSLGRLSTVIAHEIRNPLMIIKASLRTLANQNASRTETTQALVDVDEEVARLNRIVNDVLDFARPIRFEYAAADVNALCRDAVQSTRQGHEWMEVQLRLDQALRPIVTDAERLRTALINIFANARQAVAARAAQSTPTAPDITLTTDARTPGWVRIAVRDRGIGVKPEDIARVFDPYFTTKRTGSGLGLAIAKNIVEGLGGSLALESEPGVGTEIRIDIPSREGHA